MVRGLAWCEFVFQWGSPQMSGGAFGFPQRSDTHLDNKQYAKTKSKPPVQALFFARLQANSPSNTKGLQASQHLGVAQD